MDSRNTIKDPEARFSCFAIEMLLWTQPNSKQKKGRKENFQGNCQGNAGPLASSGPSTGFSFSISFETSNKTGICMSLWSGPSCGSWLSVAVNCVIKVPLKSQSGKYSVYAAFSPTGFPVRVQRAAGPPVFRTLPVLFSLFQMWFIFASAPPGSPSFHRLQLPVQMCSVSSNILKIQMMTVPIDSA